MVKPVLVNMKYSKNTGLSGYVARMTSNLPIEAYELDATGSASRGGFVKQVTSSVKMKRFLAKASGSNYLLSVSLDGRYLFPDIVVVHHLPEKNSNWIEKRLTYRAISHAKQCIAISDTTAEEIRERFIGKNVKVIKNGLDVHEPLDPLPHDEVVIFHVGGISSGEGRRKPMLQIPDAISQAFPDEKVKLVHFGGRDNENERALEEACMRNGISTEFRKNAPSEELWSAYANSDLYIYMSEKEGYSLTPMEALSMGTPCLLSDIPIHREVYGEKPGVVFAENWKVKSEDIRKAYEMGHSMKYREKAIERTWDDTIREMRDYIENSV